jgi:hypothetical protein
MHDLPMAPGRIPQSINGLSKGSGRASKPPRRPADKAREEQELEDLAHEISQALAGWFEDQGREADASQIDLSASAWQALRDPALVAKAIRMPQRAYAST